MNKERGNSRLEKVGMNIITAFLLKGLVILLQFISRVIFTRFFEVSYLGITGLFTNIMTILSLAELGMETAMTYSLYRPIAENDINQIKRLISFFKKIYCVIGGIVFLLGVMLIPFLHYIVNLDNAMANLELYYFLFVVNASISYLFVYRTNLLMADQKLYITNTYLMLFKVIGFMCQTVVVIFFQSYLGYLLVEIGVTFFGNLYQNHIVYRLYPYLKGKAETLPLKEKKEIWKNVKSLLLYKIGIVFQGNTDSVLISVFVGTVMVGYYSNYILIVNQVTGVIVLLFTAIKASVGNLFSVEMKKSEQQKALFQALELMNEWIIGFCGTCLLVLLNGFISLAFGKMYVLPFKIEVLMVMGFYTANIIQVIWLFREVTGIFTKTKYITLVTTIINIILSILLGKYFGLLGILLATIIARMIFALWKEPMILYKTVFKKSSNEYFINHIRYFIRWIMVTIGIYYGCKVLEVFENEILVFLLKGLFCCVVFNFIYYFMYRNTKEFVYIKNRLLHKKKM